MKESIIIELMDLLNIDSSQARKLIREMIVPIMEESFQDGEKNIDYKTACVDGEYFVEKTYKQNRKQYVAGKLNRITHEQRT